MFIKFDSLKEGGREGKVKKGEGAKVGKEVK